mgnify:CR=1 FL=1
MPIWSCALPVPTRPSGRVLHVVERVWAKMREQPEMAGPTLSRQLREDRSLGAKERPVAGDMLLGMIRHQAALGRLHAEPVSAWLALCDGVPDLPDPDDEVDAYAVALSLPRDLAAEWWTRLGPERAVALAQTLAGRAPVWLRVLRDPVGLEIPHHREGLSIRLDGRANVTTLAAYREGRVEVQDLGSQRIAEAAFPGAGGTVLDLCAGAGGKSLALAAMGAKVTAWDSRPGALRELEKRAGRCDLHVEIAPPSGSYDVILVDAPCSGTGVLRRHPETRWRLSFHVEQQRALLERVRGRAARVVYATCSLARRENEEVSGVEGTTLWPEPLGNDGFYIAVVGG